MGGRINVRGIIGLIPVLILVLIIIFTFFTLDNNAKGANAKVDVKIDENGFVEKYKLYVNFPDESAYNEYERDVYSKGFETIEDFFLYNVLSKDLFSYYYNPDNNEITFENLKPFDPNEETKTISIDKINWIFIDSSYESENDSFILDEQINKLDYTLTMNADNLSLDGNEVIHSLMNEFSYLLFQEKTVYISVDREKGMVNKGGNGKDIPLISVKMSPPKSYSYFQSVILWFGGFCLCALIIILVFKSLYPKRSDW